MTAKKAWSSARALIQRGFPSVVKLASETIDTAEERQGLPSEESQERYKAHQALQFPSSDTSTFQEASEPFANATKTFHGRESPQLLDVELTNARA